MKVSLVLMMLGGAAIAPFAAAYAETRFMHEPCDIFRYSPNGMTDEKLLQTGCALTKDGWKEIDRCDTGAVWKYLLQKGDNFKICDGYDKYDNAIEHACAPFDGGAEAFRKIEECEKKQ